ncbi:MAG: alpha/beta hydrolase family protein [Bryobacteraceae bacterium]
MALLLLLALAGFDGHWLGTLDLGAAKLRIALHIANGKGTLDSLDQGATGIPLSTLTTDAGKINFEIAALGAQYEGALSADGKQITGTFHQRGLTLPLLFTRTESPVELARPQEPRKPYPYEEAEVTYENKGIRLAGALTLPRAAGPHPAVLLITGSGPQDRNETVAGHRPFLVLADYLTRRGCAVLRVDDRGVGGSTGSVMASTSEDFAADTLAGVAYLKARKDIDARRIGLLGHSEGGLVGAMAAARSPDVAFLVMMAGPGVRGDRILLSQIEQLNRIGGVSKDVTAKSLETEQRLFDILRAEKDNAAAVKKMEAALPPNLPAAELGRIRAGLKSMTTAWYRAFLEYDPAVYLSKVKIPVLALNGELDVQVAADLNLPAVEAALKQAGNRRYSVLKMARLNHLFQHSKDGSPAEYSRIEETIAPEALKAVGDWIATNTSR